MSKPSEDDWIWDDSLLINSERRRSQWHWGSFFVGLLAGAGAVALAGAIFVLSITGGIS